jgi:23S rRNA (guanosine2251-2'-O)-methyltransferase
VSPPRRGVRRPRPVETVIVGRRPVLEALRAGAAREVLVAQGIRPNDVLRALLDAAGAAGVPIRRVPAERIDRIADGVTHQGVAARVRMPPARGERALDAAGWPDDAVVLVLDGVTDPRNVGALARTAEAAGASAMVVRRRRGGASGPAALKTSAGALAYLPLGEVANLPRALGRLRSAGFWVVGLDEEAARTIHDEAPPPGRLALVVGSEGRGLSRLTADACDDVVGIPLRGRVGSLNVSVAAGVGLFAYAARGRPDRPDE